ncbi:MAG: SPOR domain-containing protein [Pseudobdellovibrionaceae bacterium]
MGAKTDVIVKMVLVFFISLLSFSIGTFVGKKYSDNQHKIADVEPGKAEHSSHEAVSPGEHGDNAKEHVATKNSEGMSDEEIAKLAAEFVADDSTATTSASNGHEEHGTASTEKTTPSKEETVAATTSPKSRSLEKSEPLSAAKNIVHGGAISEKDTRTPSSIPKDVNQYSVGKFTVQVGAYAKEDEAQKIAGELKSKGFSAFYIPATVKGQTWFRVSVGLFATPKEAQDYRSELMAKAKLSSALVQKIIQ